MDEIRLGVFPAMSHYWHSHSESWFVVKVIKTLVHGIKALFGRYSVNVLASTTPLLMRQHPEAAFSKALTKPLKSYQIDIPALGYKNKYIQDKVSKLCQEGRKLEVQLVFDSDSIDAVPLYYSQNEQTENLNVCVDFPDSEDSKIVCLDLAHAYSIGSFGRGKKAPFDAMNTISKLESFSRIPGKIPPGNHGGLLELFINAFNPREVHYFPATHKDFSRALEKLALINWNLPNGIEKNYLILFNTRKKVKRQGHAVAFRFKKQEGCLKCICYEPNDTSRHLTVLIYNPVNAGVIVPKIMSGFGGEGRDLLGCIIPSDRKHWIPLFDKTKRRFINSEQCDLHFYGDIDDPTVFFERFPFFYCKFRGRWKGQFHNSEGDYPFFVDTNGPQGG